MKTSICGGILILAVALAQQIVSAQGTMTFLSNLGQASAGSLAVGSDSWLAAPFRTGTNAGGYALDSIQLAMTDASGNPSGLTAFLYSATFGPGGPERIPFVNIGTFSGSLSPATGGIYTHTTTSNMTLFPNTTYFIVLTAGTSVANGAYSWSYTGATNDNSSENWSKLSGVQGVSTSTNGNVWIGTYGDFSQFAINATAIPEPGVLGLLGMGGLARLWHRRKAKAV